jgi:hemerythrin
MALFEWTEDYSVNVRILDDQHRKLVGMVNELHDAISTGTEQPALKEILKGLLDYTAYHFVSEERLLQKYEYPGLDRHKAEHETLTWKVLDLRSRYERGEGVEPREVLDFLTGWLKDHILNSDRQYGTFLNSKGVQ